MPSGHVHRPPAQTGILLTRVPVELRLIIYTYYSTTCEEHIKIQHHSVAKEPALLATCHLIRAEATAVHYKHSRFVCEMGSVCRLVNSSLGIWLRQIGLEKASMIENFTLLYMSETEKVASISSSRSDRAKMKAQNRLASEQFLRAVIVRGMRLEGMKIRVEDKKPPFSADLSRAYWKDGMRYAIGMLEHEEAWNVRLQQEVKQLKVKDELSSKMAVMKTPEPSKSCLSVSTCIVM